MESPNANAISSVENPSGTTTLLLPKSVFAATALPHPKSVSTQVPINSATYFFITTSNIL